jgi:alkanesulfonate monooxygenase SsuD/methylene tetrahydromethanopterin reductase-like flavin-dependent oxidoreductase (luciferase family)
MKIGLYLPHWTGAIDGDDPRWADVLQTARAAEQAGFSSVWVIGHHYLRFERGRPWSLWDPWSMLAGLAAATEHIALGPLVSCTAHANPALLARTAATVDEISRGRLILGIGGGYFGAEFEALGIPAGERVDRFEEAVQIISRLLRDRAASFEGRFYRADLELDLPRCRPGGPPILIGASHPRMLSLAARYADLWNAWLPFSTDPIGDLRALRRSLDRACAQEDRDPATLRRTAAVAVGVLGRTVRYGPHEMVNLGASQGEIIDRLRDMEAEGIEHVQLCCAPATPQGIEALAPVVEALAAPRPAATAPGRTP